MDTSFGRIGFADRAVVNDAGQAVSAANAASIPCAVAQIIAEREEESRASMDGMRHFMAHQTRYETDPAYAAQCNAERAVEQARVNRLMDAAVAKAPAFKPWRWTPGCDVVGAVEADRARLLASVGEANRG